MTRFAPLNPALSVEIRVGGAPPQGARRDADAPPPAPLLPLRGWPLLQSRLPLSMQLEKASLVLDSLGVTTRGESWVLRMLGGSMLGNVDALVSRCVGGDGAARQSVWVDWPFCCEARVSAVADAHERRWRGRRGVVERGDMHPLEWKRLAADLREECLRLKGGIDVGDVTLVLYVHLLEGTSRPAGGGPAEPRFAEEPTAVPAQLVVDAPPHAAAPTSAALAAAAARLVRGCRVLVAAGEHTGCVGVVVEAPPPPAEAAADEPAAEPPPVKVRVSPRLPMPPLPAVHREHGQSDRELALRLSIPGIALAKIISSVTIVDESGKKQEVGLGIRLKKQRLVAVGWARLRPDEGVGGHELWEFSNLAERTLREYKALFPQVFSQLSLNPQADYYEVGEVFPDDDVEKADAGWSAAAAARPKEAGAAADAPKTGGGAFGRESAPEQSFATRRLGALLDWLNGTGARQAKLVPADMLRLSAESVELAEAALETAAEATKAVPKAAAVDVLVPAKALLRPADAHETFAAVPSNHAPGDAVAHLRASGTAPFGERGIVLAVQGARCEVAWEREHFCGAGHFASLRTCRAAVVPAAALLNLSRLPRATTGMTGAAAAAALAAAGAGGPKAPANLYKMLDPGAADDDDDDDEGGGAAGGGELSRRANLSRGGGGGGAAKKGAARGYVGASRPMTEEELAWAEAKGFAAEMPDRPGVALLVEMGFGREDAAAALQASGGDVERATQALLGASSSA